MLQQKIQILSCLITKDPETHYKLLLRTHDECDRKILTPAYLPIYNNCALNPHAPTPITCELICVISLPRLSVNIKYNSVRAFVLSCMLY